LPALLWHSFRDEWESVYKNPERNFQIIQYLFFISAMDADSKSWFGRLHTSVLDDYFQTMNYFGDRKSALVAAGIGGISWMAGWEKGQRISVELLTTYGIASLISQSIKNLTGRKRPFVTQSPYRFKGPGFQSFDRRSFPSGHATIAFSSATVLNEHIHSKWIRYAVWMIAASTSVGRVYKEKHWLSDVVAGGIIGYATGKIVVRISKIYFE
jgi:membrane-associated phospholipid phosphatase